MVSLGHNMMDHTDTKSVVIKFSYLSSSLITKIKFGSLEYDVPFTYCIISLLTLNVLMY